MPQDVSTARRVLIAMEPFMPAEVIAEADADLTMLQQEYQARREVLQTAELQEKGKLKVDATAELKQLQQMPRPHRRGGKPVTARGGRPISEQSERRVATFYFLGCDKKAAEKVKALLREQGVEASTSKIMQTVRIYECAATKQFRDRPDALISPSKLPEFWLQRLGEVFQHWIRQRATPTETDGGLEVLLERFVDEFLHAPTADVVSPPWRSPGSCS